jgi:hypothetical protein
MDQSALARRLGTWAQFGEAHCGDARDHRLRTEPDFRIQEHFGSITGGDSLPLRSILAGARISLDTERETGGFFKLGSPLVTQAAKRRFEAMCAVGGVRYRGHDGWQTRDHRVE